MRSSSARWAARSKGAEGCVSPRHRRAGRRSSSTAGTSSPKSRCSTAFRSTLSIARASRGRPLSLSESSICSIAIRQRPGRILPTKLHRRSPRAGLSRRPSQTLLMDVKAIERRQSRQRTPLAVPIRRRCSPSARGSAPRRSVHCSILTIWRGPLCQRRALRAA